jgi:hypothetical protein
MLSIARPVTDTDQRWGWIRVNVGRSFFFTSTHVTPAGPATIEKSGNGISSSPHSRPIGFVLPALKFGSHGAAFAAIEFHTYGTPSAFRMSANLRSVACPAERFLSKFSGFCAAFFTVIVSPSD